MYNVKYFIKMDNEEALKEYANSIKTLRNQCINSGMSEEDFRNIYFETLDSHNSNEVMEKQNHGKIKIKHCLLIAAIGCIIFIAYNYKTVYSSLVCNMQDFVYPGLRLLRRVSIPLISLFPSLTEYYHESCLIQNPFFSVVDMDCWPCNGISTVLKVHEPKPEHQQHSAPFIYETDQKPASLNLFRDLYIRHKEVFLRESSKILVNNKYYISLEEMFREAKNSKNNYYIWRFNSMNSARILRQVVHRPTVVPKFGQSTERFLIIDTSQASFKIPDTECNFSFLLSLSGTRLVNLVPAEECNFQCKTLQVELQESLLLWYNWWYWRPVIQASNGNTTFIGHVGSYC